MRLNTGAMAYSTILDGFSLPHSIMGMEVELNYFMMLSITVEENDYKKHASKQIQEVDRGPE